MAHEGFWEDLFESAEATSKDPGTQLQPPRLLPHHERGPLGDVIVVPDRFDEPVPAGAIRESDYRRMTGVYERIAQGKSHLGIDTSNFTEGKDVFSDPLGYAQGLMAASDFRSEEMGYLRDLVKTPAGLQMLERLDSSKHRTTIKTGSPNATDPIRPDWKNPDDEISDPELRRRDGTPNVGTDVDVIIDPTLVSWKGEGDPEELPWMKDRRRFGLYHELVHAYDYVAGEGAREFHGRGRGCWPIGNTEWRAVGLGPYAHAPISENRIREQMGAPFGRNTEAFRMIRAFLTVMSITACGTNLGNKPGDPMLTSRQADCPPAASPGAEPIQVTVQRRGDRLAWSVRNDTASAIWAFLVMPNWDVGGPAVSERHALVELRGDLVLLRKISPPSDELGEGIATVGAVQLPAGGIECGSIVLEPEVRFFLDPKRLGRVWHVALEVGWVSATETGSPKVSFAISGRDQQYARSPVFDWDVKP